MASLHLAPEIFKLIYPVGSIYISVNSTNPGTLFGGTWVQIKGKFLLGHDPGSTMEHKTLGKEVGSWRTKDHTLTVEQIPPHQHQYHTITDDGINSNHFSIHFYEAAQWGAKFVDDWKTANMGGGKGHSHEFYPPALVVSMWKRTA